MLSRLWTVLCGAWAAVVIGLVKSFEDPPPNGLNRSDAVLTLVIAAAPWLIGLLLRRVAAFVLRGS